MGLSLLLSYTNCSYNEDLEGGNKSAGSLAVQACREEAKPVFNSSLYSFVRSNCTACHTTAGGRPPFADGNLDTAFQTALSYSPDQFRNNANSTNHAQGITGTANVQAGIQSAYSVWKPAYDRMSACIANANSGGVAINVPDWSEGPPSHAGLPAPGTARFELAPKPLGLSIPPAPAGAENYNFDPPMGQPAKTVLWSLGTCANPMASNELNSVPSGAPNSFACAQVQIGVRSFRNRAGQTGYLISEPRLITSANQSLEISSLLFKVNGYFIVDGTAYKYVLNRQVFMGGQGLNPKGEVLGGGSLLAFGPVKTSDFMSLSVGDLKNISMSPPPPMPRVSFAVASQTASEGSDNATTVVDLNPKNRFTVIPVEVRLDRAPVDSPVSVLVTVDTAAVDALPAAQRAKGFRPLNPNNNANNTPDWDYRLGFASDSDPSGPANYKVDSPTVAVTFYPPSTSGPGETSKTVILTLARDHRREGQVVGSSRVESVVLMLSSPTRGQFGAQQSFRLDIVDDDNPLAPESLAMHSLSRQEFSVRSACDVITRQWRPADTTLQITIE